MVTSTEANWDALLLRSRTLPFGKSGYTISRLIKGLRQAATLVASRKANATVGITQPEFVEFFDICMSLAGGRWAFYVARPCFLEKA